jgi:transposase
MRALDPEVLDAVWAAVGHRLPPRPADTHPLGCHRRRIPDKSCFHGIVIRLVTGCSWVDTERFVGVSDTTLRARRDEWIAAGVFDELANEAVTAYDRIIGLDLTETALDGSQHKAPCGGEHTGRNRTDRGKLGWKWSVLTDRHGVPLGWQAAAANQPDWQLFGATVDDVAARGLIADIETMHLDRGYDNQIVRAHCQRAGVTDLVTAKRRRKYVRGRAKTSPVPLGMRWPVERTNSWLSNFGQLRRNTDRKLQHRLAQFALAVVLIITAKLIDWRNRWSP